MGVDVTGGVGSNVARDGGGAVARAGRRTGVSCPHQPVLLVVAEHLCLRATGVVLPWHSGLRGGEAAQLAGRVVGQFLTRP